MSALLTRSELAALRCLDAVPQKQMTFNALRGRLGLTIRGMFTVIRRMESKRLVHVEGLTFEITFGGMCALKDAQVAA